LTGVISWLTVKKKLQNFGGNKQKQQVTKYGNQANNLNGPATVRGSNPYKSENNFVTTS
jgi:hypothetical protein